MKKNDKPSVYKRMVAYIIDIMIISVITSLITAFIPMNENYSKDLNRAKDLRTEYAEKKITKTEYNSEYDEISYDLTKNSIDTSIIVAGVTLIYFVVFNYYMNGMTLGKRLMKLKVVSANNKKLTLNNYLLRCLIVDSVLANVISICLVLFLNKKNYMLYNSKISIVFSVVYILCFVLIIYRADGRGFHDLISNTKVIDFDYDSKQKVIETDYKEQKNSKENGSE